MESTFKKKYETTTLQNGDLEIKYKAVSLIKFSDLFIFILAFISVVVSINVSSKIMGLLFMLLPAYFVYRIYTRYTKNHVITVTKDGIIFSNGKKQLAFKDIKGIGISIKSPNYDTQYAVHCDALGQSIPITEYVRNESQMQQIRDDIIQKKNSNS